MKLFFFCFMVLFAQGYGESTEKLVVKKEWVGVISSFEELDFFSTYSHSGDFVWEIPFGSKIDSWEFSDEALFIFSHNRNGSAYYLTCINPSSGKPIWEKQILAPVLVPKEQ